jgi:hypothetical protein
MKCFWSPYICAVAAAFVAHADAWHWLVARLGVRGAARRRTANVIRHIVLAGVIVALYAANKQKIYDELQDLR